MSLPITVLIQIDSQVVFRSIALRGDVLHVPESRQLLIAGDEGEEVLTTETPESEQVRAETALGGVDQRRLVTIKDYSEHAGLAEALESLGLVCVLSHYATGPFASPMVVAEVLAPERLYAVSHLSPSTEAVLADQYYSAGHRVGRRHSHRRCRGGSGH